MLKVVLDTSVFISGLLSKGGTSAPVKTLEAWRADSFTLVMSPQLLREFVIVAQRNEISDSVISDIIQVIRNQAYMIPGVYEATRLDDIDPDDNKVLAAAYEARANYLVSLDTRHLLPIKHFHGTQIVMPVLFLRQLDRQNQALALNPTSTTS